MAKKETPAEQAGVPAEAFEPIVDDGPTEAKHPSESSLKEDDKVHYPVGDAEPNDPPVRTNRPDVPIVQRLAVGAGKHTPLEDPDFGPDGRLKQEEASEAAAKTAAK